MGWHAVLGMRWTEQGTSQGPREMCSRPQHKPPDAADSCMWIGRMRTRGKMIRRRSGICTAISNCCTAVNLVEVSGTCERAYAVSYHLGEKARMYNSETRHHFPTPQLPMPHNHIHQTLPPTPSSRRVGPHPSPPRSSALTILESCSFQRQEPPLEASLSLPVKRQVGQCG